MLFERRSELGGQFNYARKIPGKEEFNETLRYFRVIVRKTRGRCSSKYGGYPRYTG